MKKTFLFIALFISVIGYGQTIDTTLKSCTAAKINSVVVSHGFPVITDTITHVGFFDYTDDLKGNCVVNWVVMANGVNITFGKHQLPEKDYDEWDGTAEGLLVEIAEFLHLTFK